MKDKELLELNIELVDKYGIQEKYVIEYINSTCIMSNEHALEEYNRINIKCRG